MFKTTKTKTIYQLYNFEDIKKSPNSADLLNGTNFDTMAIASTDIKSVIEGNEGCKPILKAMINSSTLLTDD